MRLFDRICTMAKVGPAADMRRDAQQYSVLSIDTIANYYGTSPKVMWGPEEYPYATPPWTKFFVEWREPKEWRCGDEVQTDREYSEAGLIGYYVTDRRQVDRVVPHCREAGFPEMVDGIEDQIDAFLYTHPIIAIAGVPNWLDVRGIALMRKDGFVLRHSITGAALEGLSQDKRYSFSQEIGGFHHMMFLAFTFANCSNVKLEDVTEQEQPPAKIRRRLKLPEVKRYTLNIAGHSTKRREGTGEPQEGIMPFHLCRGHFATYTPEKPMFGNPKLIGRYWHPPHTRGKKERGEIIKDYAIAE